jgi:predicted dehydrogenase
MGNANKFAKGKNIKAFSDMDSIDIDYDVVYIATPNSIHYSYALKFINKKKNVLVEKVMTTSAEKTKKLFEAGVKNNVKVMEAFTHISNPTVIELAKHKYRTFKGKFFQKSSHVKNNTISESSSFSKKLYGGVTSDIGVYLIALSVYFLGNVKKIELNHFKMMNDVDVYVDFKLIHMNGEESFIKASKMEDGDNSIYLDNKKVSSHPTRYPNQNHDYKMA